MLMQYHWPGNVRELENCLERAVLLCEEGVIHSYHLPPTLQTGQESLKNTRGNITSAARILQTTVRKFAYKAQQHGVDYRHYRA